jgi:hypothetical protein
MHGALLTRPRYAADTYYTNFTFAVQLVFIAMFPHSNIKALCFADVPRLDLLLHHKQALHQHSAARCPTIIVSTCSTPSLALPHRTAFVIPPHVSIAAHLVIRVRDLCIRTCLYEHE